MNLAVPVRPVHLPAMSRSASAAKPFASRFALALGCSLLFCTGCPMPQSNAAKMQDTASDFNTNIRFGRMSLAVESVAPKERDAFLERRKAWGERIQLGDYELVSAKMVKDDEAVVVVKYDWYDVTAGDLHVTKIKQSWSNHHGAWLLDQEERESGAEGIFQEPEAQPKGPAQGPAPGPVNVQFPTVRLGD